MWFTKPIDLARQFVRPASAASPLAGGGAPLGPGLEREPLFDVRLALSRPELDRFAAALLASLGPIDGRLDSPARLAAAIDVLVAEIGGHGRTRVVRRPAGLTTPEAWEVDVANGCDTTQAALDALARGLPLRLAMDVLS